MNRSLRKFLLIFILLATVFTGMEPSFAQAGTAPSISFGWAKAVGGSMFDSGEAIAVDGSGNVYTTGYFNGAGDFDPGSGVYNLDSAGFSDIFIGKLDSGGNFAWAKRLGGTGYDFGFAMTVDAGGNVYTTGYFHGTVDFDPGGNVYELSSAGWSDIFVSKLDSKGSFLWAKAMGGSSDDIGNAISVDASGNVYTTGFFRETGDFDPGAGINNLSSAGEYDIFVSKLDEGGNFVWAKAMGGTSDDYGMAISAGEQGTVYTAGYFFGTADYDPGPDVYWLFSAGSSDVFVSKLDSGGNFVWAKGMGGISDDIGNSIAVDASGNVYTTGSFLSMADFDPGESACDLISAGGPDIFISKLDSAGAFVWVKSMGGSDNDFGYGITLDASGNVYSTGYFFSTADFDPGTNLYNLTSAGEYDVFVSKLDNAGTFLWAQHMGGGSDDHGNAIAVGPSGNVYTTGSFLGTSDFDPGAGIYNLSNVGEDDIFISKLLNPVTSTLKSIGAQDGWILEKTETSNKGNKLNNAGGSLFLGDNVQKKQYRSILSFDTKDLPDNAVITKITLKVKKQGIAGAGNPVNLFQGFILDVKKGFFGPVPDLQANDFQGKPHKSYGPFKPALENGWYSFDLTPAKTYINQLASNAGVTQIRLRFQRDDNNNSVANYLKLYSGNAPIESRPQLIVEYYLP